VSPVESADVASVASVLDETVLLDPPELASPAVALAAVVVGELASEVEGAELASVPVPVEPPSSLLAAAHAPTKSSDSLASARGVMAAASHDPGSVRGGFAGSDRFGGRAVLRGMSDPCARSIFLSRRSILWGAAACASTALLGCGKLTTLAETLLDALTTDDWGKLLTIAGPELLTELDEDRFHQHSAEYQMLGPLRDHSRMGIGTNDGKSHLDYNLDFDAGTVSMKVVSRGDRLDGFSFEGPPWVGACDKLHQKRLIELLDAAERGDLSGARAVVHTDIPDPDLQRVIALFHDVGARRSARYLGFAAGRKIELEYERAKLGGEIGMRGGKLGYFEFRPR